MRGGTVYEVVCEHVSRATTTDETEKDRHIRLEESCGIFSAPLYVQACEYRA